MKRKITLELTEADARRIAFEIINPKHPNREELVQFMLKFICNEDERGTELVQLHNCITVDYAGFI